MDQRLNNHGKPQPSKNSVRRYAVEMLKKTPSTGVRTCMDDAKLWAELYNLTET